MSIYLACFIYSQKNNVLGVFMSTVKLINVGVKQVNNYFSHPTQPPSAQTKFAMNPKTSQFISLLSLRYQHDSDLNLIKL